MRRGPADLLARQQIVARSGTAFFPFQKLDSTQLAGTAKIRTETISCYLDRRSALIIRTKLGYLPPTAAAPEFSY